MSGCDLKKEKLLQENWEKRTADNKDIEYCIKGVKLYIKSKIVEINKCIPLARFSTVVVLSLLVTNYLWRLDFNMTWQDFNMLWRVRH